MPVIRAENAAQRDKRSATPGTSRLAAADRLHARTSEADRVGRVKKLHRRIGFPDSGIGTGEE